MLRVSTYYHRMYAAFCINPLQCAIFYSKSGKFLIEYDCSPGELGKARLRGWPKFYRHRPVEPDLGNSSAGTDSNSMLKMSLWSGASIVSAALSITRHAWKHWHVASSVSPSSPSPRDCSSFGVTYAGISAGRRKTYD
jgi:hypothetical protein